MSMKFECTKSNLLWAVHTTSRSAGKQIDLPILSHVKLQTARGRLSFTCTNLELATSCTIGAKIEEEGAACIPADILQAYIQHITSDQVAVSQHQTTVTVSAGSSQATIQGLSSEEFPVVPDVTDTPLCTVKRMQLAEAIRRVVFAATKDEARPELSGVFCVVEPEGVLRLAATDSFRLAEVKIPCQTPTEEPVGVIIPARVLREIQRLVGTSQEEVVISLENGQVSFSFDESSVTAGSVECVSRTIEGRYPDYQRILPDAFATTVTCSAADVVEMVKAASVFSKTDALDIRLEVDMNEGVVRAVSESGTAGTHTGAIAASVDGPNQSLSCNYRFLLDGIAACDAQTLFFGMNGDAAPMILRAVGDDTYTHVVMPIKV